MTSSTKQLPQSNTPWLERHFLQLLAAVCLLALALRLGICLELAHHPTVVSPIGDTDMATYLRLAKEICQGQWPDHFDYQPLYYTVILPFCRMLGGDSRWPLMLLNVLASTAAVWLAGICGAQLFGRRAGIAAAALLALSRMHVFYTPFALYEVLQSFWMALLLWLGLLCWTRNRAWLWLVTALTLSAATLTRGNALLLLPVFLVLLVWRNGRHLRTIWLALAFVALFEVPQLPYAIRNYHYAGRWVGASTAGDKVLVLGNSPEAPAGGLLYPPTYHWWVADSERKPPETRVGVVGRILKWMCQEPLVFLDLEFRKCLLFWDKMEIANNVSLDYEGRSSWIVGVPWLLPFALLGPLAMFGLFRERRLRRPGHAFLFGMFLICWLGTALFYILARFRICTLPLFCIYAGFGLAELLALPKRLKAFTPEVRRQRLAVLALCLLGALFLCDFAYVQWCHTVLPCVNRFQRPNGQLLSFPNETILQDNGPLLEPGRTNVLAGRDRLIVEKKMLIPADLTRACTVQLPVRFQEKAPVDGVLEVDGQRHPFHTENLISTSGNGFAIRVSLPGLSPQTTFRWIIPPHCILLLDEGVDYGRTSIVTSNGLVPLSGELAMELHWEKK
ncbi:MAG: glycosyltransferase family 39 protein [Victivallales bacterium]|nr:glycosyltransferase family 39 protein [Victivallales bacterium]